MRRHRYLIALTLSGCLGLQGCPALIGVGGVAAFTSRFSAGFFSGSKQASPSASQFTQAAITALRRFWQILEPVTRAATFCSSFTFQLM